MNNTILDIKMKNLFNILASFLILFAVSGAGRSQTGVSTNITYSYDSNTFRNYLNFSDQIAQGTLYLNHDLGTENTMIRFYYEGSYYRFKTLSDRNFLFHQSGMAFSHEMSTPGNIIYSGVKFSNRTNKEAYNYYNFNQFIAYANGRFRLGDNFLQAGYRLRERTYPNLEGFSYWEHWVFLRVNRSFETRTSLTLQSNFGFKNYVAQTYVTTVYDSTFGGGWNKHMGRHGVHTLISVEDVPSAELLTTSFRVAQSIAAKTGLSFDVLYRYNFNSEARYLTAIQSGYTTEDELFDDPYGYKGLEYTGKITQIFPHGIQSTFSYTITNKFYPGHLALDLEGNPVDGNYRSDQLRYFYAGLEKSFSLGHGFTNLTLYLDYYRMANRSNDAYYQYKRSLFSSGIAFNF